MTGMRGAGVGVRRGVAAAVGAGGAGAPRPTVGVGSWRRGPARGARGAGGVRAGPGRAEIGMAGAMGSERETCGRRVAGRSHPARVERPERGGDGSRPSNTAVGGDGSRPPHSRANTRGRRHSPARYPTPALHSPAAGAGDVVPACAGHLVPATRWRETAAKGDGGGAGAVRLATQGRAGQSGHVLSGRVMVAVRGLAGRVSPWCGEASLRGVRLTRRESLSAPAGRRAGGPVRRAASQSARSAARNLAWLCAARVHNSAARVRAVKTGAGAGYLTRGP